MSNRLVNFRPEMVIGYQDKKVAMLEKRLLRELLKTKEQWMERQMKKILPPSLFKCAQAKKHLRFVARWISKNGYSTQEGAGVLQLLRNGTPVAGLRYLPELKPPSNHN